MFFTSAVKAASQKDDQSLFKRIEIGSWWMAAKMDPVVELLGPKLDFISAGIFGSSSKCRFLSLSLSLSDSLGLSDSLSFLQYLSHFLIHLFFATACQVHYRSLRKIILKNGTSKKFLFLLLVQTKNPNKSKKIFPNNPFWKRLFKGGSKRSSPRRGFGVKFTFLISVFHCFQVP